MNSVAVDDWSCWLTCPIGCEYRPVPMPRVLLVHANSDDREMYADYLRVRGYDVTEVSRTDAAIPLVPSADILITGLLVPGDILPTALIAGTSTARWGKTIPVIVVTATSPGALHREAKGAGAGRILLKPCYPGDLLQAIEAVLQGAAAPGRYDPRT